MAGIVPAVHALVMCQVTVVMAPVMLMKIVKPVLLIAVNAVNVMPAMYQIVPITIDVQKAGLVMVLKTV
jgi:hypothetical protein